MNVGINRTMESHKLSCDGWDLRQIKYRYI